MGVRVKERVNEDVVSQVTQRFPGRFDQVRAARQFVRATLPDGHPCRDDAVLLVSETVTNALRHTDSGNGGDGTFSVFIRSDEKDVSIAVTDDGSSRVPCTCRLRADGTTGRGVAMVDSIAERWGFSRAAGRATVWFEIHRR